jgi:hypothetical protein
MTEIIKSYKKMGETYLTMAEQTHIRRRGDEGHYEMYRNKAHQSVPNKKGTGIFCANIYEISLRSHVIFFSKSVLVFQVTAFQNTSNTAE